jgi:hypothetical protein
VARGQQSLSRRRVSCLFLTSGSAQKSSRENTVLRDRPAAPAALTRASNACPGCRIVLPVSAGPTHAYVGASPACWELYCRLTAAPYARRVGTPLRRLVEDTYAVQHPGKPDRRCLQSVAVHLMGLCVLLERGGEERRLAPVLGKMPTRRTLDLHWLTPPARNGSLTVADALEGGFGDAHAATVEAWARSVWKAWTPHHATVRGWLDASGARAG